MNHLSDFGMVHNEQNAKDNYYIPWRQDIVSFVTNILSSTKN
jgi:hypothetical protein